MSKHNPAVYSIGFFYLVLGVGAAILMRSCDVRVELLPLERPAWAGLGLVAAVALSGAIIGLSAIASRRFPWARALERDLATLLGPLSVEETLLIAILSGGVEEILFRGAIQSLIGPFLASLLFGAVHVGPAPRRFLPWTVFATAVGFIFAALVALGFGLVPAMLAHALINFVNLRRMSREWDLGADTTPL